MLLVSVSRIVRYVGESALCSEHRTTIEMVTRWACWAALVSAKCKVQSAKCTDGDHVRYIMKNWKNECLHL